jgi:hypothetical protein
MYHYRKYIWIAYKVAYKGSLYFGIPGVLAGIYHPQFILVLARLLLKPVFCVVIYSNPNGDKNLCWRLLHMFIVPGASYPTC